MRPNNTTPKHRPLSQPSLVANLTFLLLLVCGGLTAQSVRTIAVDPAASTLHWQGYKLAGNHTGTIQLRQGELMFTDAQLTGGRFRIDMSTIEVTDLGPKGAAKLTAYLKDDDFFGVEAFPEARLVITAVVPEEDNRYQITADLRIRDVSQAITFPAHISRENGYYMAKADISVNRHDFGVSNRGSFFGGLGDRVIYDNFDLTIRLLTAN